MLTYRNLQTRLGRRVIPCLYNTAGELLLLADAKIATPAGISLPCPCLSLLVSAVTDSGHRMENWFLTQPLSPDVTAGFTGLQGVISSQPQCRKD